MGYETDLLNWRKGTRGIAVQTGASFQQQETMLVENSEEQKEAQKPQNKAK